MSNEDKRVIDGNTQAAELYGYSFEYKERGWNNTQMYHVRRCHVENEISGENVFRREKVRVCLHTPEDYRKKYVEQFSDAKQTKSTGNTKWLAQFEKVSGESGIDLLFDPTLYKEEPAKPIEFKTKSSVSQASIAVLRKYAVESMGMSKDSANDLGLKDLKALVIEFLNLDLNKHKI